MEKKEEIKPIIWKPKGEEYVLEYDAEAVKTMERMGFSINTFEEKPVQSLFLMFRGAFFHNHRMVTVQKIEELFRIIKKDGLVERLIPLYNKALEDITGSDDNPEGEWA